MAMMADPEPVRGFLKLSAYGRMMLSFRDGIRGIGREGVARRVGIMEGIT